MSIIVLCLVFMFVSINQLINGDKRFQESNKIEQLWRYRFYVYIPFLWMWYMIKGLKAYVDKRVDGKLVHTSEYGLIKGEKLWKILIGNQQGEMGWYYTSEEVFDKIKKKIGNN